MDEEQLFELIEQYINGNRISACLDILTGPNPVVDAAKVAARFAKNDGDPNLADEFIQILTGAARAVRSTRT